MSRFDDGAVDVQELLRRLAEQVVNAVMDAGADRLCDGANSCNGYREGALATCVGRIVSQVFCGRGHVRAGRDMAGVQVLLGDEGTSSTTRGAGVESTRRSTGRGLRRRPGRLSRPASSLRAGSRPHRILTVFQMPDHRTDSLRIGCQTIFLVTSIAGVMLGRNSFPVLIFHLSIKNQFDTVAYRHRKAGM